MSCQACRYFWRNEGTICLPSSRLEKRPNIQLITVGPVIDLYGRFAAEKLARLMEIYPDRVFSKPEFTALPPYLFSGADFALIPSRDEPFGLVAVEFGRKGALGVGSRLGGLGLMPGWVSAKLILTISCC
jgi:alpha-1,3-glucan synthase